MKFYKKIFVLCALFLVQLSLKAQVYESSDEYFDEAKNDIAEQNYTKAAKLSWRGLQLAPDDLDLKILLGKANLSLGRYDTARWVLREVYERRRKDITVLSYLVTIEENTQRYSDAVCYVNELLEITPYSRGWWMRKINIYKKMGNFEEAERALTRLYQIYPDDTEIKEQYNYVMLGDGTDAVKNKQYDTANKIYKTVIDNDPTNKNAYLGIVRNELLKGNPEYALQFTNRALLELPQDRELIDKKIGLLEQLGRHEEAIAYIKTDPAIQENYPDIIETTLPYLMQQSASFNEYNDPYEINKELVELNGNSISQNYVIQNALGKGYDVDAEYFIKKGLSKSPNNKDLLIKLKELYRPIKDKERFEKEVIKLHEKFPDDADITYDYNLIMYNRGKDFIANRQFDEALAIYQDLIGFEDFSKNAEQQIFSIYLELGKFDEATEQIDKLIGLEPDNPEYLLKKSTLYEKMDLYDDALQITASLENQYPENDEFKRVYISQIEAYAVYLMNTKRYPKALEIIDQGLQRQNNNKLLLDLGINGASAIKDYEKAINYSKSALSFYPNNKNFSTKLSGLYAQNKEYEEAIAILDKLSETYLYDRKIRNSLAEVYWYRAKDKEDNGLVDEAIADYNLSDSLNPDEKFSRQRLINLYISQKSQEEAMAEIDRRIEQYPDDSFIKYKKGVVFELQKKYDSAYYYQKFRELDNPYEQTQWNETLSYLEAADLKNQLAATYTEASSDSIAFSTSLAGISYNHKYDDKNAFGADVNYAARRSGVGVQGGVNYTRVFSPTLYANAGILFGTKFFPKFVLYGTAYKGLGNGYEVEAGLKFQILQDDLINLKRNISFLTLHVGGSKSWEDIKVGSKLSLMRDDAFTYVNLMANAEINVNARKDHVSFLVSGGSAPFDTQLPEGEAAFLNFSNILIGAGYLYNISPRTAFNINGSWINFQTGNTENNESIFVNQYNLTFTIITKF